MSWSLEGRPVRSLLVSRLRYLGDIAMATVLLEVLKRGAPELEIGFLCEEPYAPLLAGQPDLRRVHPLRVRRRGADARARGAEGAVPLRARGWLGTVGDLRDCRYDVAVDLFFNPRSAALLRAAGSRGRVGGSTSWRRRLYTHLAVPPTAAARPRFRALAPGGLGDHLARLAPLRQGPAERPFLDWFEGTWTGEPPRSRVASPPLGAGAAREGLARLGVAAAGGFLLLAPGATWPFKEWPAERWRELIVWLGERQERPLVVLAPPARRELYAPLAAAIPPGHGGVLPVLELTEALRVLAAASLLIAVDGGIMHAAVAMRRPTLALFGPTAPGIWFPYESLGPYRVVSEQPPCHPCDLHVCGDFICLPAIPAERVGQAALGLLRAGTVAA